MVRQRDHGDELERIERKLDRLTNLVAAVLFCQPVLFVAILLPGATTSSLAYGLLALLTLLAAFPNLESTLPDVMRRWGRMFGRTRRWLRESMPV